MLVARSLFLCSLFAFVMVGCGDGKPSSATQDEMSQYVQENPEAAKDYSDVELDAGDTAN
ncbi:MAG: hypothetical protein WBD20_06315 [Pirellulaceae bacterium]